MVRLSQKECFSRFEGLEELLLSMKFSHHDWVIDEDAGILFSSSRGISLERINVLADIFDCHVDWISPYSKFGGACWISINFCAK